MRFKTENLVRAGVIAALYVVLSLITYPVASGVIQFRISEGLTLLALIYPEAVLAVFFGCFISNVITGCFILDVILGSVITLAAGVLTCLTGKLVKATWLKLVLGGLFPVLLNAFLLPVIWYFCYGTGEYIYIVQVALLIMGEGVSVYAVGVPLYFGVSKVKIKTRGSK